MTILDATTVILTRASDRAETLAARAGRVQWAPLLRPLLRRLPLLLLMVVPFLVGFALRWTVRGVARAVWACGWLACWLFYTAQEGWTAAAGGTG